jgi:hypothetical protein
MKPKAPKKVPMIDSATLLTAWLAVIAAAVTPVEIAQSVIPFAYAEE